MQNEGKVGPIVATDGTLTVIRLTHDSSEAVQDSHARFQEAVYRGNVYTLASAVAGVTGSSTTIFSASPVQPIVGLYNPAGSGKDLVIWRGVSTWNSGTPGTGGLVWGIATGVVTGTSGATAINNLTFQNTGYVARTFTNTPMTASGAGSLLDYAGGPAAFALAAGAPASYIDYVDGRIICIPGNSVFLTFGAAGTSPIANGSITWEEIAI